jgi:hypothetical protein
MLNFSCKPRAGIGADDDDLTVDSAITGDECGDERADAVDVTVAAAAAPAAAAVATGAMADVDTDRGCGCVLLRLGTGAILMESRRGFCAYIVSHLLRRTCAIVARFSTSTVSIWQMSLRAATLTCAQ